MADDAANPHNPDEVRADTLPGTDAAAARPASTIEDDTEALLDEIDQADLESQVDDLLAEVSSTVQDIRQKLDPTPEPEPEPVATDQPISDDGVATGKPSAETADQPEAQATPEATAPAPSSEPEAETDAEASSEPEPEANSEPEAEPVPEATTPDQLAEELASELDPQPEPAAEEPAPDTPVSAESVQSELEAALAGLADGADIDPIPGIDAPRDTARPENAASPSEEAEAQVDDAEPAPPQRDANRRPEYTDVEEIDSELAALAAEALDDDLETTFGSVDQEPSSVEPSTPEPATNAATNPATNPATQEPDLETEPEDSVEPNPAPETSGAPSPAATPKAPKPNAPRPKSTPVDRESLRWGWLPPKPEWPEVYSKARPLVIAWRHTAWVVPPFAKFAATLIWKHTKTAAVRTEPHLRHAAAVVATPLSCREERTRSAIGWLAIYTLFLSTCLMIYVLVGRSPVAPENPTPATTLAGEMASITADQADARP